jgi:putative oxygen-independent coproporphyrinogen III oxidase
VTAPQAPVDPLTGLQAARFGLYLHFPYCHSKCPYCDFASTVVRQIPQERYADAVLRELELRLAARPELAGRQLHSVYIGGGTPSLWHPPQVARVLKGISDRLPLAPRLELTLEANPGAADASRFADLRAAGVNRLSIGVQSFDPQTLGFLGRAHDGRTAEQAYRAARDAGFDNVSMDFIYGVPGQSVAQARADAQRAAALAPEHLSAYALTLDKASLAEEVPLARQLARGEVALPADEEVIRMHRAVRDAYLSIELERYEISNYARPGFHSRHNALYWTGGEYLALGSGATGHLKTSPHTGIRYGNLRSAEHYLNSVEQGRLPEAGCEALTAVELLEERLAMGLRLAGGIDLAGACQAFGVDPKDRLAKASLFADRGLLVCQQGRWALTDQGADLHSAISARLM